MALARTSRFSLGREITVEELDRDPYPVYARLREHEPISWVAALNMWYVVGYEDVRTALLGSSRLTTASAQSMIFDTFGAHMPTTEAYVVNVVVA
jgi:cytochrome P450